MKFIEFLHEPSFEPTTYFQLVWTDKYIKWLISTWDNQSDWEKFHDPIQNLKYIGKDIKATITSKTGVTERPLVQDVLDFVRNLSIKPRVDRLKFITLDGSYYSLNVGVDDIHTTYRWHTTPEEWSDLKKLTEMLLDLQTALV